MVEVTCLKCGHTAPISSFNNVDDLTDHGYHCRNCGFTYDRRKKMVQQWMEDADFRKKFRFKVTQMKLLESNPELNWVHHDKKQRRLLAK